MAKKTACYNPDTDMVTRELFDAAIKAGSDGASKAGRFLAAYKTLLDATEQALHMMSTGRVDQARDRLERAVLSTAKLLT